MNPFYKVLVLLLFSFSASRAFAQADTTDNDPDTLDTQRSHLKIGIAYVNNSVYLGRTDLATTETYSASLNYTLKFGLYFSGSIDLIPSQAKKLNGGDLEVGYEHSWGNFESGLSFTKLFYNSTSTQVSSSISSIVSAYADYDVAGIITPAIVLNYNIAKKGTGSDFMINPNLSHDFTFEGIFSDHDYLVISPEAGLNAGTQNYYSGYLEKKGVIKRLASAQAAAFNAYYDALGKFKLLDYEVTAPIVYKTGKFRFSFTPTYAFAQDNLPYGTAFEKNKTDELQATSPYKPSVFYFSASVSVKF